MIKSWEDIQNNFTVPLQAVADVTVLPEEDIMLINKIKFIPFQYCCKLNINSSVHVVVMINDTPETNAKINTEENKVELSYPCLCI